MNEGSEKEATMAGDDGTQQPQARSPHPGLKPLERLIGKWKISGEQEGETSYRWMDGGHFLIQNGVVNQAGRASTFMEIIGYDRALETGEPAEMLTSRIYTSTGDTLDYRRPSVPAPA